MNPARSRHATTVFPSDSAKVRARSRASDDVATVLASSTSFMAGAGLKK